METFAGQPPVPAPWQAAPYPATHPIASLDDAVFLCVKHLVTALHATGHGVIYLTPSRLLDFAAGEAVVQFDLSTLRSSPRDWIDLWVSPYEQHLQLPLEEWLPDLQGPPRHPIDVSAS